MEDKTRDVKFKHVFNPLKTKLIYILFQNSVRTSKKTPHFTLYKDQLVNAV